MRMTWFMAVLWMVSGVPAHAAEPDSTVVELPRRPRPTASAPT